MPNPTNPNEAEDAEEWMRSLGWTKHANFYSLDSDSTMTTTMSLRSAEFFHARFESQHQKWLKEVEEREPKPRQDYSLSIEEIKYIVKGDAIKLECYNIGYNAADTAWRAALREDE